MSCTVAQLKSFLAELNDDDELAIDDGGLCLVTLPEQLFSYEIGGVPLEMYTCCGGNNDTGHKSECMHFDP